MVLFAKRAAQEPNLLPDQKILGNRMLFDIVKDVLTGVDITTVEPEIAYAVDVEKLTARPLVGVRNRAYGQLGKYEIPATLDLVAQRADGHWKVRDWKFGVWSTKYQILVQAMAVAWHHNVAFVDAGTIHVSLTDRTYEEYQEDLFLDDLEDHARQIKQAIDKAQALAEALADDAFLVPDTHMGAWCKYCPALPYCPSRNAMLSNMLPEVRAAVAHAARPISSEECGRIWNRMREIEHACEQVRETLLARLETDGGFPMPSGKTLRFTTRRGYQVFERDKTYELLKRLGASEEDINGVKKRLADVRIAREVIK